MSQDRIIDETLRPWRSPADLLSVPFPCLRGTTQMISLRGITFYEIHYEMEKGVGQAMWGVGKLPRRERPLSVLVSTGKPVLKSVNSSTKAVGRGEGQSLGCQAPRHVGSALVPSLPWDEERTQKQSRSPSPPPSPPRPRAANSSHLLRAFLVIAGQSSI